MAQVTSVSVSIHIKKQFDPYSRRMRVELLLDYRATTGSG
ncbi:hypothetical protein C5L29_001760 [Lactiplantibacillus pentosus]|nr:hypothetical protein C5L29_001760 [Lactiplantibacillus pentosus]